MSVATKLDIVASAKDGGASAMLQKLRKEMAANEEQFHKLTAAQKENASVDDIWAKARSRKVAAEVKGNEAKANERRKIVEAARAAREDAQAKAESTSATDKMGGALKRVTGAQEIFNKVMGAAGWLGILGGVGVALVQLIAGQSAYAQQKERMAKLDGEYNELLKRQKDAIEEVRRASMTDSERELDDRRKRAEASQDDSAKGAQRIDDIQRSINLNLQRQAVTRLHINNIDATGLMAKREMADLEDESRRLNNDLEDAKKTQADYVKIALQAVKEANPEYQKSVDLAKQLTDEAAKRQAIINQYFPAPLDPFEASVKAAADAQKKAADEAKKAEEERKRRGQEAARRAESERKSREDLEEGLRKEIALFKIATGGGTDYQKRLAELALERDTIESELHKKKIARSTAELQLEKNRFEFAQAVEEENKRVRESTKAQTEKVDALSQALLLEQETNAVQKQRLGLAQELAAQLKDIEEQRRDGGLSDENARISAELAKRIAAHKEAAIATEEEAKGIESIGDAAKYSARPLTILSGRLEGLAESIGESSKLWGNYARGQSSVGSAVAGTASIMGAAVAGFIKDKKLAAGVAALFETAAGFATMFTNPAESVGHFTAAALFGLVAGGAGSAPAAKGGGKGKAKADSGNRVGGDTDFKPGSSRPEDTRQVIIMQNRAGVIMGTPAQVARSLERQSRSLRGTGYSGQRWR